MKTKPRSTSTASIVTVALAVVGIVVLAIAVSIDGPRADAAASPSVPPTTFRSPIPSRPVDASTPPSVSPSAPAPSAPAPKPTPRPTQVPAAPASAAWSKPVTVPGLSGCYTIVAAVDDLGSEHLAATCYKGNGSELRYSDSRNGRNWTTATLKPPTGRYELDPQLALDANKLYLAYTRVAPTDGGCGDDG